jgi:hypothetical protein
MKCIWFLKVPGFSLLKDWQSISMAEMLIKPVVFPAEDQNIPWTLG